MNKKKRRKFCKKMIKLRQKKKNKMFLIKLIISDK